MLMEQVTRTGWILTDRLHTVSRMDLASEPELDNDSYFGLSLDFCFVFSHTFFFLFFRFPLSSFVLIPWNIELHTFVLS